MTASSAESLACPYVKTTLWPCSRSRSVTARPVFPRLSIASETAGESGCFWADSASLTAIIADKDQERLSTVRPGRRAPVPAIWEVTVEDTKRIRRVTPCSRRWIPRWLRRGASLANEINRLVPDILGADGMRRLDAVGGWLHMDEGMTLFYFAHQPTCDGRLVEIGTFLGKATSWMASALKVRQSGEMLVTMDPHEPIASWEKYYDIRRLQEQCCRVATSTGISPADVTTYELFLDNMAALELSSFVEPVRGMSTDVITNWNQPIRMLFIDGSHRYECVLKDLQLWEPWLCEGGILCAHDTGDWEGVARAVKEYVTAGGRFKKLLFTGNLTVFRKRVAGLGRGGRTMRPHV